ncbi:cAMP responsive element modulator b isoform X2 [Brachyhypopomus gauderio]|uniref:cAMP responsive element modulator b isoform X2 n=1 Tax=Brachyhypopomus gauderio TaxID=698409 RepID=UPI0040422952
MDSDGAFRQVQNQKRRQAASFELRNELCRGDEIGSQQKREVYVRSSYRNLNELASDTPAVLRGEKDAEDAPASVSISNLFNANASRLRGVHIGSNQQGLPTFSMSASRAPPQSGPTIVQYSAQSGGGTQQYYVPANKVVVQAATGDMSAYQMCSPTSSLPQGVVMTSSPGSLHSPQQLAEDASRKRELRLMKNREAARECRRKKKEEAAKECRRRKREYIRCLETRLTMLEVQNKKLFDELQYLKEIYAGKSS